MAGGYRRGDVAGQRVQERGEAVNGGGVAEDALTPGHAGFRGLSGSTAVAAWRAGSRDPAVAAFVQAAFEVARSAASLA